MAVVSAPGFSRAGRGIALLELMVARYKMKTSMNVMVSPAQRKILNTLEDRLEKQLPILGRSREGYVFTEVDGITVVIATRRNNPNGGYKVPSVRTYPEIYSPTNIEAAISARKLFAEQAADASCTTGHFGPIVKQDWSCNRRDCPCNLKPESYEERYHRSTGR